MGSRQSVKKEIALCSTERRIKWTMKIKVLKDYTAVIG